jgi:hypothetical protein
VPLLGFDYSVAKGGEAWADSESRQMLEHAIENGRGGVYLRLTPDQPPDPVP